MNTCGHCGEDYPPHRRACPHCGADDQTGWSADADDLSVDPDDFSPLDDSDYDDFLRREGISPRPRSISLGQWILVAVAAGLVLAAVLRFG